MNAFKKAHLIAGKTKERFDTYQEAFNSAIREVTEEAHKYARENQGKYPSYRAAYTDAVYAERHECKEAFYRRIIRVYGEQAETVTVKFRKVSTGETRIIIGKFGVTEWIDLNGNCRCVKGTGKENPSAKPIYEFEKRYYRSFRYDSVIWIKIDGRKFKYGIINKIKAFF